MSNKNTGLSKVQKIIIVLSLIWEIIAYDANYKYSSRRLDLIGFVLQSMPVIIYYSILWIWGAKVFTSMGKKVKSFFSKLKVCTKSDKAKIKDNISDNNEETCKYSYKWSFIYWVLFFLFARTHYNMESYSLLALKLSIWQYAALVYFNVVISAGVFFFVLKLIAVLCNLVHKNNHSRIENVEQKGMPVVFVMGASVLAMAAFAYKYTIHSNSYVEKTKEQIVDVYDGAAEGNYDKAINNMDFKPGAEMYNIILSHADKCFSNLIPEDITTEENYKEINSKEGIDKLYKRGLKIVSSLDAVSEDASGCFEEAVNFYTQQCKEGKIDKICFELIKETKKVSFEKAINVVNEAIRKRKEVIRDEFKIYECLHKKHDFKKCSTEIEKYKEEINSLVEFQLKISAEIRNHLISELKTK